MGTLKSQPITTKGSVIIPAALRRELGWEPGDQVILSAEDTRPGKWRITVSKAPADSYPARSQTDESLSLPQSLVTKLGLPPQTVVVATVTQADENGPAQLNVTQAPTI